MPYEEDLPPIGTLGSVVVENGQASWPGYYKVTHHVPRATGPVRHTLRVEGEYDKAGNLARGRVDRVQDAVEPSWFTPLDPQPIKKAP